MHFPCSPRHRPLIGCNRGAFTAGAREVVGQVPSTPSGFASRLEAVEDGLNDVKTQQGQILDQQQQLLDAVTALARHVVPHKRAAPPVDNRVASSADEAGPSQPLPKLAKLSPLSPEAE
jgi:hypothetical protein